MINQKVEIRDENIWRQYHQLPSSKVYKLANTLRIKSK